MYSSMQPYQQQVEGQPKVNPDTKNLLLWRYLIVTTNLPLKKHINDKNDNTMNNLHRIIPHT